MWHLGLVNAVGFAAKKYHVTGIDLNKETIKKLQQGTLPLFEPGLTEAVARYTKEKLLTFSDQLESIGEAEYVIIAYDSPIKKNNDVDIAPIIETCKRIAVYLRSKTLVIITSQIPLGTSEIIESLIRKENPKWLGGVVYTPENLQLGSAIERFLHPDMLVFGVNSENARKSVQELYKLFVTEKIFMNLRSAEMVKHALNAFLATAIAFGNEIAHLCDRLGADSMAVASALRHDKRIGKAPIFPGLGFSGGTLARDVQQLKKFAQQTQYPAPLIQSIIAINEDTFEQIILKLKKRLKTLKGKTIGLLGLTYKPNTSTLRQSPSLKLAEILNKYKARCFGYDPQASKEEFQTYTTSITRIDSVEKLAHSCDALVLVTEWTEFRTLDFSKLARLMKTPVFIDAKNFLDPIVLGKSGFIYEGYGRGMETKETHS